MKLLSFLNDLGIIPNKGKSYEKESIAESRTRIYGL